MQDTLQSAAVDRILEQNGNRPSAIISILRDIQNEYRYLPREIFPYVAKKLRMSEATVYSVATFYENFSLEPKGKHIIKVCDGTACHVRKSIPILQALRKELSLSETKHTTDDMLFTVETVACLGACGLSPVITIDNKVYGSMTPEKAVELIAELRKDEGQ
ncbi:MAG: NAD(P)H-dependent oxidoreductase subunit E [Bacillota bacterium]